MLYERIELNKEIECGVIMQTRVDGERGDNANISKTKVLGTKNKSKVILEKFEEDNHGQLWKKGEPNAEGYFTLENSNVTKIMTANYLNSSILQIKGNITINKMDS